MCGIAAAFIEKKAFQYVYSMLIELQHRGQESAGITILSKNGRLFNIANPGYVFQAIEFSRLNKYRSSYGIGHVRYSTTGSYIFGEGVQPILVDEADIGFSLAFNGNIINYLEISREVLGRIYRSDTEVLANLIKTLYREYRDLVEAVKHLSSIVKGSYSLAILSREPRIVLARDIYGFKPLTYSYGDNYFLASSESSALESIGINLWRELEPGEVLAFSEGSIEITRIKRSINPTPCAFEYIYFSRPDSVFNNIEVHRARVTMGELLGYRDHVDADIIIPVPDSGRSAAIGYSRSTGIPLDEGLMRNRYVGRGFITPPSQRRILSELKYSSIKTSIAGKDVVIVDDSLIRGTTIRRIIKILRRSGARKIHVRIASPPIRYPCFMGIDFPTRRELIASNNRSVDEVRRIINADSLKYLDIYDLKKATGLCSICLACFTGRYPIKDLDVDDLEKIFYRGAQL